VEKEKQRAEKMEVDKVETQQQEKQKQVHLFYCVESEELARNVAAHSELITLQSINWRSLAISLSLSYCSYSLCSVLSSFFNFIFVLHP
jgi:hypothetical protein